MELPPQMTQEELEQLINVANPLATSSVGVPAAPIGGVGGSSITYFERPENISYSMENLPLWMQDFKQVSPTTYAPDQGVFNAAPIIDSIQATMPQDYIEQYQQLEEAYQESLGIDPSMFGGEYRSGIYMPTQVLPEREGEGPFDITEALAAYEALKEIYPYVEEGAKAAYDPVEEFVQQNVLEPTEEFVQQEVLEPTEEFVQQNVLDPAEDTFKAVADPVEEVVQQYVLDPTEDVAKIVLDPVEEVVQQAVLDPIEDIAKIPLKALGEYINQPSEEGSESVLSKISESLDEKIDTPEIVKSFEDDAKSFLDSLPETTTNLVGTYADVENMIDNPSSLNVDKAITSINDIGFDAKEFIVGSEIVNKNFPEIVEKIDQGAPIVPPVVGETLATAADIDAIIDAFENPDAESLTNAYAAADAFAMNYTESGGLPAGEAIGEVAAIFTGLEALDGGIESLAEAVNVAKATQTIGTLTGSTATFDIGASMSSFLAPIGVMTTAMAVMDTVSSLWQGSAAGDYPNSSGSVSFANGQFTAGDFGGGDGASSDWGKAASQASASVLNSFVKDGFVVDEAKAQQVLNSGVGNIASNSYYSGKDNRSANPQEVIYELMKSGAITPTENTSEKIIKSNESFNNYIKGKLKSAQNSMASRLLNMTEGSVSKSPPVPFATSSAAKSYINRYGTKQSSMSVGNKTQQSFTSFELGKKTDGNQFLNKSIMTIDEGSKTGRVSKFDELGKRFGPQETVKTHYIYRGQSEPKNSSGFYDYNPKYDISRAAHQMYSDYITSSRYGGYHVPPMQTKQSGSSALAKDAKLYMTESDWKKTFTGSF